MNRNVMAAGAFVLALTPTAWGYTNGHLPGSALAPIYVPHGSGQLTNEAAASWNTMRLYFVRHGQEIYPAGSLSSYRTYSQQVYMKQVYGSNAATPGTSNHGWGLAVDLATTNMRHHLDAWGAHFGWAKRWSDASWEWWHIKYRSGVWQRRPDPGTSATYPILRHGSGGRGQDAYVESVERNLRKWGYKVPVNGRYDGRLARAVKRFQRAEHLKADGVVGQRTWAKLKSKPPKKPKKPTEKARAGTVPSVTLAPGDTKTVTIAFRNLGSALWTPSRTFLETSSGAGPLKVAIDAPTRSGEVGKFVFNVTAPTGATSKSILEKLSVYDGGKQVPSSTVGMKVTVR